MAKCTVKDEPTYVLELSKLEAETLYRLVANHIVGRGLREVFDGIYVSLEGHGLESGYLDTEQGYHSIYITEELPQ